MCKIRRHAVWCNIISMQRYNSSLELFQAPCCASGTSLCPLPLPIQALSQKLRHSSVTQAQAVENNMQSMYICLSTNVVRHDGEEE